MADMNETPHRQVGFYEYPELYHFFYSRAMSHEKGVQLLDQFQPADTSSVLELGCGTGLLLSRIEDDYETVVGVDVDAGMLEIAREETTDVTLREADITTWSAADEGRSFDATIMSGTLFHIVEDAAVRSLATNIYESLRDGGTFASSFIPLSNIEMHSISTATTVESDRYRVKQRKISVGTSDDGQYVGAYLYLISDKREHTQVTIGSVEQERWHPVSFLDQVFTDAGFQQVELLDTDSPKVILYARR